MRRRNRPANRPRLRRSLAVASATAVAFVAVGGSVGVWPVGAPADSRMPIADAAEVVTGNRPLLRRVVTMVDVTARDVEGLVDEVAPGEHSAEGPPRRTGRRDETAHAKHAGQTDKAESTAVPAKSGEGRRVVFDISAQRVWLVRGDDTAARTYPVSGSKHDNLSPGHYEVYSTSRHATSYTYEETMEYMVRFTRGDNAAIGFHDIPVGPKGKPVQTRAQLGEPLSSGCIRQQHKDAKALWRFAPVGTDVVVVA